MIIQYSENNDNRIEWQHRRGGEWRTAELHELIEAYERATEPGDLISREQVIAKLLLVLGQTPALYAKAVGILNSLPSSEIIRCKDCKWFGDIGCAIRIVDDSDSPSENDFCSFAERKDNE